MANFCTGCGAPLSEGKKFCTECGTPVAMPMTATPQEVMMPVSAVPIDEIPAAVPVAEEVPVAEATAEVMAEESSPLSQEKCEKFAFLCKWQTN